MNIVQLFVTRARRDWTLIGRFVYALCAWVLARRWATRVLAGSLVIVAAVTTGAAAYAADDEARAGNPFLDAFNVKDTHGFSATQYDLNMDNGGKLNFASQYAGAMLVMWWDLYRVGVSLMIWLFNWALGFKILDLLIPPANAVANTIQRLVDLPGPIGPVAVMLTVAIIPIAYWIQSGKAGAGIVELLLSLTAAALVGSALASPVDRIAGDNGLIVQARDVGVSLSTEIVTAGRSTGADREQLEKNSGAMLADVFIRTPHQLINYGAVVGDDPKCVKVYDKVIKGGPYEGDSDKPRTTMGECNPAYEAAAKRPITGFVSMTFLAIAALFLGAVVIAFVLGLTWLAAQMVLSAATLAINLLKAILPGTSREGVATSAAVFCVGAVMIIAAIGGAGVFTIVIGSVFSEASPYSPVVAFVILDLLLVMTLVYVVAALIRAKKASKKLGEKWGKKLSPAPTAVATGGRPAPMRAVARQVGNYVSTKKALGDRPLSPQGPQPTMNAQRAPGAATATAANQRRKAGLASRTTTAVGKGTFKAAKLGVQATIGAPVAYPQAARAAKAALAQSRSRVQDRLTDAKSAGARKVDGVNAYGREYVGNVVAAGRFASKVSGATKLAGAAVSMGAGPLAAGALAGAALAAQTSGSKGVRGSERPPARHSKPSPKTTPGRPAQPAPTTPKAANPAAVPPNTVSDHEAYRQRLLEKARERRAAARVPTPMGRR